MGGDRGEGGVVEVGDEGGGVGLVVGGGVCWEGEGLVWLERGRKGERERERKREKERGMPFGFVDRLIVGGSLPPPCMI